MRLYDYTNGVTASPSLAGFTATTNPSSSHSIIKTVLTVPASTTYELQARCQVTKATDGYGIAANFGAPEIYTQIKIMKLE